MCTKYYQKRKSPREDKSSLPAGKCSRGSMSRIGNKRGVFDLALFFLVVAVCDGGASLLAGVVKTCSVEGERAIIPYITEYPCISCLCKGGYVQCSRERCQSLHNCSFLIQKEGKCCKTCQTCSYGGHTHRATDRWVVSRGGEECTDHVCQDGIVTRAPLRCHVACKHPIAPPPSTCGCPICKGCVYQQRQIDEGDTIEVEGCATCMCKNGNIECRKKTCPVPACEVGLTRMDSEGCCPMCVGNRTVFDLENGRCWFRRGILDDGEEVNIGRCTSCVCRNGTIVCDRTICPHTLECPIKDRIYSDKTCCPVCSSSLPKNCIDDKGDVVKHGKTWKESRNPCLNCLCGNGNVSCTHEKCNNNLQCPQGQSKETIPGSCCPSCVQEPGVCAVFGDPHYRTFDGRPFNFQGDCMYMLAKDCLKKNFTVIVQNNAKRSPSYSWTNKVYLKLIKSDPEPDTVISLHQRLMVKVNGVQVSLPYVNTDVLVWIEHHIVKVRTNAGISLNWDGDSFLEVGASSYYRGRLCGLCGNFNGFLRDDFIGGDGVFKFDNRQFAESWQVGHGKRKCSRREFVTRSTEPCVKNLKLKIAARKSCQIFKSSSFQACHFAVDPLDYYKSCLTDSCECPRNKKCSCESIRAYVAACARRNVVVSWDENQHCRQKCNNGKVFTTCASKCKTTCKNYRRVRRRKRCQQCTPGCRCPAGYVIKDKKCIKSSKCSSIKTRRLKQQFKFVNPFLNILKTERSNRRKKRKTRRHKIKKSEVFDRSAVHS